MSASAIEGTRLRWPDYLIFSMVLLVSLAIGIFQAYKKKQKQTTQEYFLGSRKLRWAPVGVSILVTFQSAILYIGIPAEIYTKGTSYLVFHIGMAMSVVIAAFYFVPLLFPLKLTSAYEYLELRFHSKLVRGIGSILGMLNMVLYMGVVIYAPATAMEAVSGLPVWGSILLIGTVATLYTTLGGLRAVVWTDVFQFVIMFSGLLAILIKGFFVQGGLKRVWEMAAEGHRIDSGGFDLNPTTRHTIWGLTIGGTFTWLANIGVNQSNVQRFSSVPSLKAAKWAVLISLPGFVILGILASLVGLIVYSYFVDIGCDPLEKGIISNSNQLVPLFVTEVFHFLPGFAGLFVASLYSASLSTVSSSINSLAAMTWEDMLKWKFSHFSDRKTTFIVRIFVMVYGMLAMVVALISMQLAGSATQIALSFFGASGGPLLGLFILGSLFPWANWIGASVGAILGVSLSLWIAVGSYTISPSPSLPPVPDTACYELLYKVSNGNSTYGSITNGNSSFYHSDVVSIATVTSDIVDNSTIESESSMLEPLYRLSYLWYSTLGILVVLVTGLLISLVTGPTSREDVDPHLIVNLFGEKSSCLLQRAREKLCCWAASSDRTTSEQGKMLNQNSAVLNHDCDNLKVVKNGTIAESDLNHVEHGDADIKLLTSPSHSVDCSNHIKQSVTDL